MTPTWTREAPKVPGHYDVRNSTVILNGCCDVRRMDDGTMVLHAIVAAPYSGETMEQATTYGGPHNLKVGWGETEFRGPIPVPS